MTRTTLSAGTTAQLKPGVSGCPHLSATSGCSAGCVQLTASWGSHLGIAVVPHPEDAEHKTLAVDPELEPVLIEVIQRTLRGDTFASMCQWLDGEGIKPRYGGRWHSKSLTQVLRNPCLKGRQVSAVGKTLLTFEGLINSREFDQLQQALDNRPNKRGPVTGQTAMLTNIVVCAKCGRPLYRFQTRNTRKDGSKYVKRYDRCKGRPAAQHLPGYGAAAHPT